MGHTPVSTSLFRDSIVSFDIWQIITKAVVGFRGSNDMTEISQTYILFLMLTLPCYREGADLDLWQAASGNLNAWHERETAEQKELT